MDNRIRLCCPCHFGLESVLKYEIMKIGGTDLRVKAVVDLGNAGSARQ